MSETCCDAAVPRARVKRLAPAAKMVMNALVALGARSGGGAVRRQSLADLTRDLMRGPSSASMSNFNLKRLQSTSQFFTPQQQELTGVDADGGLFAGMDPVVMQLVLREEGYEYTDSGDITATDPGHAPLHGSSGPAFSAMPQYPCADCLDVGANGMHFAAFMGHLSCLEILVEHEDFMANITDMVRTGRQGHCSPRGRGM